MDQCTIDWLRIASRMDNLWVGVALRRSDRNGELSQFACLSGKDNISFISKLFCIFGTRCLETSKAFEAKVEQHGSLESVNSILGPGQKLCIFSGCALDSCSPGTLTNGDEASLKVYAVPFVVNGLHAAGARVIGIPAIAGHALMLLACVSNILLNAHKILDSRP